MQYNIKNMDSTLVFQITKFFHPTTLWLIYNSKFNILDNFYFLSKSGEQIQQLLKDKIVIHQLCLTNRVEIRNSFTKFISRWNLYYMFSEETSDVYRILHVKDYLEECSKVTMKPFTFPEESLFTEQGCLLPSGKFYSARFMDQIGHNECEALRYIIEEASCGTIFRNGSLQRKASCGTIFRNGSLQRKASCGTIFRNGSLQRKASCGTIFRNGSLQRKASCGILGKAKQCKDQTVLLYIFSKYKLFKSTYHQNGLFQPVVDNKLEILDQMLKMAYENNLDYYDPEYFGIPDIEISYNEAKQGIYNFNRDRVLYEITLIIMEESRSTWSLMMKYFKDTKPIIGDVLYFTEKNFPAIKFCYIRDVYIPYHYINIINLSLGDRIDDLDYVKDYSDEEIFNNLCALHKHGYDIRNYILWFFGFEMLGKEFDQKVYYMRWIAREFPDLCSPHFLEYCS